MADWMLVLLPLLALPIVLLFRFIGCGELLSSSSPEDPFDFTVTVDSPVEVNQNGSKTTPVTVTGSGGYNKEVTLTTSSEPGVTFAFSQNKVNPATGPIGTTLTVTADATATLGPKAATVFGTGAGADPPQPAPGSPPPPTPPAITKAVKLEVKVDPPAVQDFSVQLSPTALQVTRPNPATFTVTIVRTGGFAEAVELDILVNGMLQSFGGFNPDPIPATATSSIATAPTAAVMPGTYTFAVRGRGVNIGITNISNGATLTVV